MRLKARCCDFSNGVLFVVGSVSRDDWSVGGEREVDARVGHQIGLELGQVNVQSSVKAKGGSDRADDLSDQTI